MCRQHLELYAFDSCQAGQEFCITYGSDKSNLELMRDYGFCMQDNKAGRVYLVQDLKRAAHLPAGALQPTTEHVARFADAKLTGSHKVHSPCDGTNLAT